MHGIEFDQFSQRLLLQHNILLTYILYMYSISISSSITSSTTIISSLSQISDKRDIVSTISFAVAIVVCINLINTLRQHGVVGSGVS